MTENLPDPLESLRRRTPGSPAHGGAASPAGGPGRDSSGASAGDSVPDPAHTKLLTLHIAGATPRERGLARASAAAGRIRATVRGYGRLFDRLGIGERGQKRACRATLGALRDWDPAQAEELAGIATGSGLNIPEIMLVAARTEILALARAAGNDVAVPGECSTLALQRPGSSLVAQTWDWHAEFTECWHAQYVEAVSGSASQPGDVGTGEAGLAYAGLAEFGMPGKIGMNSAGVGVNLNILKHVDDTADGVPLHAVLARILGTARSVDEALTIIAEAPTSASSLITVSGPDRTAMVEIRPGAHSVLEPGEPGVHRAVGDSAGAADSPASAAANGGYAASGGARAGHESDAVWFCHTNDFQHAEFGAGQDKDDGVSNSPQRFAVLDGRVAAAADTLPRTADDMLPWLGTDPGDELISRLPDPAAPLGERIATLATVRMDPAARIVRISPGIPQAAAHATVEFRVAPGA